MAAGRFVLDKTDRNAADGVVDRHAGVHQAQSRAADGGHRTGAVRFENVADDADRIRKLFRLGQDGSHAALGKRSVADLATAGASNRPNLADGKGRHVIIKHKLLGIFFHDAVDALLVGGGAEDGGDESLSLASLEDRRAVGARENADFASDVTKIARAATVGTIAVENHLADDSFLQRVKRRLNLERRRRALGGNFSGRTEIGDRAVLNRLDRGVALLLDDDRLRLPKLVRVALAQLIAKRIGLGFGVSEGRQAHPGPEFVLKRDDLLIIAVRGHYGVGHLRLRNLFAEAFDHHDRFIRGSDDQVEVAMFQLVGGRQGDELAFDASEPDRAYGTVKRYVIGDDQSRRGADDGQNVGIVLLVGGDGAGLDLNFVAIARGKERTKRAVNQPRGENFLGRRPTFALDEAAGKFTGRVYLFAIIDREREEIESFAAGTGDGRDQGHRVAYADDHRARGLLGQTAGLKGESFFADTAFDADHLFGRRRGCAVRHSTLPNGLVPNRERSANEPGRTLPTVFSSNPRKNGATKEARHQFEPRSKRGTPKSGRSNDSPRQARNVF